MLLLLLVLRRGHLLWDSCIESNIPEALLRMDGEQRKSFQNNPVVRKWNPLVNYTGRPNKYTNSAQKSTGRPKKSTGNYQPYQPKYLRWWWVDGRTDQWPVCESHDDHHITNKTSSKADTTISAFFVICSFRQGFRLRWKRLDLTWRYEIMWVGSTTMIRLPRDYPVSKKVYIHFNGNL